MGVSVNEVRAGNTRLPKEFQTLKRNPLSGKLIRGIATYDMSREKRKKKKRNYTMELILPWVVFLFTMATTITNTYTPKLPLPVPVGPSPQSQFNVHSSTHKVQFGIWPPHPSQPRTKRVGMSLTRRRVVLITSSTTY